MKIRRIFRFLSIISAATSASMVLPLLWSFAEGEPDKTPLLFAILSGVAASGVLALIGRSTSLKEMNLRESILSVVLSWVTVSLVGGLPYLHCGAVSSFLDAFFEAISGFTTTGASIILDLNMVPRSVLLWRSFTQWLGGIGIIVLMLAFLPISDGGMYLYKTEIPGPVHDKMAPRMQQNALLLGRMYLMLTISLVILLSLGGLDLFDSLTLAFSTVATGGFSPYYDNVGHFNSDYVKIVVAVFFFLSGTNFTLYYLAISQRTLRPIREDPELSFYVKTLLVFGLLTSAVLYKSRIYTSVAEALGEGFFHTASTLSTCGFFISDHDTWPASARFLMLLLMFCGGCALSSSGGITCIRLQIVIRHVRDEFFRKLNPRAVLPTRLGKDVVESWVVSGCFAFFAAYMGIFSLGFLLACLFGQDLDTALFGVAATLGNIGPGYVMVESAQSYAMQPDSIKLLYIALMLCGRLEIFTLLVVFTPSFRRV